MLIRIKLFAICNLLQPRFVLISRYSTDAVILCYSSIQSAVRTVQYEYEYSTRLNSVPDFPYAGAVQYSCPRSMQVLVLARVRFVRFGTGAGLRCSIRLPYRTRTVSERGIPDYVAFLRLLHRD